MTISAPTFSELVAQIESHGLTFNDICRSPIRVYGMWICEVAA